MSDHPFATLRVSRDELAAEALSADRLAAVVESIRTHGAAIIEGAVEPGHCDRLRFRWRAR